MTGWPLQQVLKSTRKTKCLSELLIARLNKNNNATITSIIDANETLVEKSIDIAETLRASFAQSFNIDTTLLPHIKTQDLNIS